MIGERTDHPVPEEGAEDVDDIDGYYHCHPSPLPSHHHGSRQAPTESKLPRVKIGTSSRHKCRMAAGRHVEQWCVLASCSHHPADIWDGRQRETPPAYLLCGGGLDWPSSKLGENDLLWGNWTAASAGHPLCQRPRLTRDRVCRPGLRLSGCPGDRYTRVASSSLTPSFSDHPTGGPVYYMGTIWVDPS